MNFKNVKYIKSCVNKIIKFKKLYNQKNLPIEEFKNKMKVIFNKFSENYPKLFKIILKNDDISILNMMFQKIDIINKEFEKRKGEISIIKPFIEDAIKLKNKENYISKNSLINFYKKKNNYPIKYKLFLNKYTNIINRLIDKDNIIYDPEILLFNQVKYKYEIDIGEVLVNKYIKPVVNQ